jgi:hypothetical protein
VPYTAEQEADFKRSFSVRRRRQLTVAIPFVLVMVAMVIAGEGEQQDLFGLPIAIWGPVLAVLLVGVLAFSFRNWRCPACDKYLGKAFNPSFCPKCGVALR